MKGLESLPTVQQLEVAYAAFLQNKIEEMDLAHLSQWCRLDPRLAQIWVEHVKANWERINPILLRNALLQQPWPAAAAVLIEFAKRRDKTFRWWQKAIVHDFKRADWEQYFIGLRQLGGDGMVEDACRSLEPYRKWGYLAADGIGSKSDKTRSRWLSASLRQEILASLLKREKRITAERYWNEIQRGISLRQAERDLARSPWVKRMGQTRGSYYVAVPSRKTIK